MVNAQLWTEFIEQAWEDNDVDAGFRAFESLLAASHLPLPILIRQLLSFSLSPSTALQNPSRVNPKELQRHIAEPNQDPFVNTERAIRVASLRTLYALLAQDPIIITRALPHYEADPTDQAPSTRLRPGQDVSSRDEEDLKPIRSAAIRLEKSADVWEVLGGEAGMGKLGRRTRERPLVPGGGWPTLKFLIDTWAAESDQLQMAYSPALLQQFRKPEASGPRSVSDRALDIVFHSFSEYNTSNDEAGPEQKVDDDELSLGEKKAFSIELLALIAQLALQGKVVSAELFRFLADTYVNTLSSSAFTDFFDCCLASRTLPSRFLAKLAHTYIDLAAADDATGTSRTSSARLNPPVVSPRRISGAHSQLSQTQSSISGDSQSQTQQPVEGLPSAESEYYALPSSSVLLRLCAKKPRLASNQAKLSVAQSVLAEIVLDSIEDEEKRETMAERLAEVV